MCRKIFYHIHIKFIQETQVDLTGKKSVGILLLNRKKFFKKLSIKFNGYRKHWISHYLKKQYVQQLMNTSEFLSLKFSVPMKTLTAGLSAFILIFRKNKTINFIASMTAQKNYSEQATDQNLKVKKTTNSQKKIHKIFITFTSVNIATGKLIKLI